MNLKAVSAGLILTLGLAATADIAHATSSIFELRITNSTDTDLTFRLHDGKSKHARLTYNGKSVDSHKVKAGAYGVVGVQATGNKCSPDCGACTPTLGKVYAYYKDENGDEQRSNYYEASVEFSQYCGVAADKPLVTYTSNWHFDHGTGKGTGAFNHSQNSSHNSYTSSNPAKGLTVDAKYISGHANLTYTNK